MDEVITGVWVARLETHRASDGDDVRIAGLVREIILGNVFDTVLDAIVVNIFFCLILSVCRDFRS